MILELVLSVEIGNEGYEVLWAEGHNVTERVAFVDNGLGPNECVGGAAFGDVVLQIVAEVGVLLVYVDLDCVLLSV